MKTIVFPSYSNMFHENCWKRLLSSSVPFLFMYRSLTTIVFLCYTKCCSRFPKTWKPHARVASLCYIAMLLPSCWFGQWLSFFPELFKHNCKEWTERARGGSKRFEALFRYMEFPKNMQTDVLRCFSYPFGFHNTWSSWMSLSSAQPKDAASHNANW